MSIDSCPSLGHVFWLFGLSGAGKTTLAAQLAAHLRAGALPVLELDGDVLRTNLCRGLGFSESDRTENLRRAASVGAIALKSELIVIASFITPLESQRQLIASILPPGHLSWIHVDAPIGVCKARDVKGLYASAQAGKITQMTGVSAAFEPPVKTDLVLNTESDNIDQSSAKLFAFSRKKLALGSL